MHGGSQAVAHLQPRPEVRHQPPHVPATWQGACDHECAARSVSARNPGDGETRVYCDHCQTTVVEGARFCPFCGGKLTEAPVAEGAAETMVPSQAPTIALTIGPCESCGAPSLPGSTLCLPCTPAFCGI